MDNKETVLEKTLLGFFEALKNHEMAFCIIGNYSDLPKHTENDVDIWVEDPEKAESILLETASLCKLELYLQNKTANGTNNYFYCLQPDGSFEIVKIDLMRETAYRSFVPIVTADIIRKNIKEYKNFFVVNETVEGIMHLLYPLVTFGIVKDKYKQKIFQLAIDDSGFKKLLTEILGDRLTNRLIVDLQNQAWKNIEAQANPIRKKLIFNMIKSFDVERFSIGIRFVNNIVHKVFHKNGIVISLTGIDGAGKTTIKNFLYDNAHKYFTKGRIKEYYWRPFLLPRLSVVVRSEGEKEHYDTSGRRVVSQGGLKSIKNYLKYFYYVTDFVIGQSKYFHTSHTGGLVIFDRYHFDNIIYPERFGFKVNKNLMRFIEDRIIPQPDIKFYLTANTKTLFERKHEIDMNEIEHQKSIYANEITKHSDEIITIYTDDTFESSINEILIHCFRHMAKRYEGKFK